MKVQVLKACIDCNTYAPYSVGSVIDLAEERALNGIKRGVLKAIEDEPKETKKKTTKKGK
jgi:hypothetical protein